MAQQGIYYMVILGEEWIVNEMRNGNFSSEVAAAYKRHPVTVTDGAHDSNETWWVPLPDGDDVRSGR